MIAVDCPICMGKGFALVRKDTYEYKYACTCRHGDAHRYDGAECPKHKSRYRCGTVDELPSGTVDELIRDNMKRYGIVKSGGRYLMEMGQKLPPDEIQDIKAMAWQMMGVKV